MEIAPDVHQVRLLGADTFVILGPRLTLIDAGMIGARAPIERYLRRIGRSIGDVDRIICTHGHPDHIGGLAELTRDRDQREVVVLMHAADIAGLRVTLREVLGKTDDGVPRRGRLIQYLTRTPAGAEPIADGQVLPLLGGLRVVHTPGHTPGSVCLYAEQHRLLFTGDVLQVIRGRLTYASTFFSHDIAQARASVARLAELDVETIAMSHYRPWRRAANEALRALAERAAAI